MRCLLTTILDVADGSQKRKCGLKYPQSDGQVRASETTDFEDGCVSCTQEEQSAAKRFIYLRRAEGIWMSGRDCKHAVNRCWLTYNKPTERPVSLYRRSDSHNSGCSNMLILIRAQIAALASNISEIIFSGPSHISLISS